MPKNPQPPSSRTPPRETGAIRKPRGDRITVALCHPNRYQVAMGALGFHQLYHLFNQFDQVVCERAVFDPVPSRPVTIESGTPISGFEIIAFSISYETDLVNLAAMLERAGVPLDAEGRERANAPLVLVGGALAFLNPEPLAPFADAVAVGEAEAILPGLIEALLADRARPREELLRGLARAPGVYVPSLYAVSYFEDGTLKEMHPLTAEAPPRIKRLIMPDLAADPARTRVFTDRAEFSDLFLIELSRGCPNACRFCSAAYIYRPPRWTPSAAVMEAVAGGRTLRKRAGLVAASATDHPEFAEIVRGLRAAGMDPSPASLRLDQVSAGLLSELKRAGHKTLTLAPEAGGERLRRALNKPISDERILSVMELVGASGLPRLKLYFQVGLPGETIAEAEAVVELVKKIKAALAQGAGKRSWPGRLSLSVNPFVPKPATPLQWEPMAEPGELKKRLNLIARAAGRLGASFSGTSVRESTAQALIARGDRRLAGVIAHAVREDLALARLMKNPPGSPPLSWFVNRDRDCSELLPWDFIDHGFDRRLLQKEREKFRAGRLTPPCRPGRCRLCAACNEVVERGSGSPDH